jgi:hypothetical protein
MMKCIWRWFFEGQTTVPQYRKKYRKVPQICGTETEWNKNLTIFL